MMKRYLIAALALATTLPAAVNVQAQDDDIYFSKKAHKKATTDAVYAETAADEWSTDANNDWDLDAYNRRGSEALIEDTTLLETPAKEEKLFSFEVVDKNGKSTKLFTDKDTFKGADIEVYKVKGDTLFLYEQYYYTDLIRRFYNPYFGYYRYCPWYDVAYYDPFYWDYCYYDPWWYISPSFGFRWGNWFGAWNFGYYTGWYGGWYSPYYTPMPHYFNCYWDGPYYYVSSGNSYASQHRGANRNNFGGHFAHRGGWRGDGGTNRMASASSNRSYRAANGARISRTGANGLVSNGPSLRGRNTTNGRIANSTMRSVGNNNGLRTLSSAGSTGSNRTGNIRTRNFNGNTRGNSDFGNNSDSRREAVGMRQSSNGSSVASNRQESRRSKSWSFDGGSRSSYSGTYNSNGHSATRYSGTPSSSSSSSNTRSYSNNSSSSYNSGSSSYSSGSSYSGGGGHSSGGGGSHSSHSGGGGRR